MRRAVILSIVLATSVVTAQPAVAGSWTPPTTVVSAGSLIRLLPPVAAADGDVLVPWSSNAASTNPGSPSFLRTFDRSGALGQVRKTSAMLVALGVYGRGRTVAVVVRATDRTRDEFRLAIRLGDTRGRLGPAQHVTTAKMAPWMHWEPAVSLAVHRPDGSCSPGWRDQTATAWSVRSGGGAHRSGGRSPSGERQERMSRRR